MVEKRKRRQKSKFFPALCVIVGTTIGAGFLGIPYVVSKSGFFPGLFYLIFVALFILFVRFYLGEVVLRTKGNNQLTEYARKYLGKKARLLMLFAMVFGIYSALVAYLIGEGQSLSYIIFGHMGYALYFSIGFWFLMSLLTYIGLKALKKYEKIGVIIVMALVLVILIFFAGRIDIENLTYIGDGSIFLPFGVILFSFLGFSAMPEAERILLGQEKKMKKVIFYSILIPFIVYLLFMFVVVGVFGQNIPEVATLVLGRFFSILGVLTMFTAFFALSLAIRDMYRFDYDLGRFKGWLLCSFVPLILFLIIYYFNIATFTQILATAGIISGGVTGILILFMNKKAKKLGNRKPEYTIKINNWIIALMSVVFVVAVVLELFY